MVAMASEACSARARRSGSAAAIADAPQRCRDRRRAADRRADGHHAAQFGRQA